MEGRGSALHGNVDNNRNGSRGRAMQVKIVAEFAFQDTKDLHTAIDSFVTSPRARLGNELNGRDIRFVAHTYELGLPTVTIVSFYHLTAATVELVNKTLSEDNNVRVGATRKRTVNPDNLTGLNAYGKLIAHTRAVMLVTVPFRVERLWLVD
jgi:hypothetical protein